MGKRKEHLDINFPYRGWDGENLGSESQRIQDA